MRQKLKQMNLKKNISSLCLFAFLMFFSSAMVIAQEVTVSGQVTDSSGEPLPGVTLQEQGKPSNVTISDFDGKFDLKVSSLQATITSTYVGFVTQTIALNGRSFLTIRMQDDTKMIDELVVIGYGTKRKGGLSSAVSTINSDDIARSTSTTTTSALVGKVAGVTARQKSGTPGSGATLQIRNMGTPLYVIDGIMQEESDFNNLDINDIDNISILKDGAAAIYGIRAANGVILVTTKKGKLNQKAIVTLNASTGWQQWTKYPELLNAYEWNYAMDMRAVNSRTFTKNVDGAKAELEKWRTGYYDPVTGQDYRGYDWYGNFVDNAAPQSYINATISGGSETTNYYISLGHVDQDAVFKDYNFNRTNFTANFEIHTSKVFKIGIQTLGKIETRRNPALPGNDDYAEYRSSIYNLLPTWRPYANDNPNYLNNMQGHDAARNLAAYTIDNAGEYRNEKRTIQPIATLDYTTPIKGLTAKGIFSYYFEDINVSDFQKGWKEYTYNHATQTYDLVYDRLADDPKKTYLGKTKQSYESYTGQMTLNFDRTFAENHNVTAVYGLEFTKKNSNLLSVSQSPITNPFIEFLKNNENNKVVNSASTYTTLSHIFRAGYAYDQKYIIDFSGRYDATWRFPSDNRWAFFPSVSAAWRVSEEIFFKNWPVSEWFTNLKLRASYGSVGDENLNGVSPGIYDDFRYFPGYYYGSKTVDGDEILIPGSIISNDPFSSANNGFVQGAVYKGLPITNLSWMKSSIVNIGVDLGFFNNRLNAEFDVFKRVREGLPVVRTDVLFPKESGLTVQPENLNSDKAVGIDGFIKWNDNIEGVNYFVGVNATLARQKNGKQYGEIFFNAWDQYRWAKSERWVNVENGQVWMYETIGVFQTQEEIDNYPVDIDGKNNTTLVPGDLIFKDVNGDGIINEFDERPLGYAAADWPWDSSKGNKNPLLSMGLNFGFEWNGFDFAADFAGGFMNTFVADWHVKNGVTFDQAGFKYNSLDVWRHEDIYDPTSPWVAGKFPALRETNPSTRWWNDYYSKKINYLRLRNLVVGYTVPKKWTEKAYIERLRFYFEGTNLFCWDSLSDYGFDPEISTVTGYDYPQHRVYLIGVNITF